MLAREGAAPGRGAVRPPWWMMALAAAFAGYYLLLLHSDLTRPEPIGVVLELREGATVVRTVPGSPAARAGVTVGDRVLAADGHPVAGALDWIRFETNIQSGRPIHLEVERRGRPFGVDLVLSRAPAAFWTSPVGATLLAARTVQFVTLALALFVVFRRPDDSAARLGAWVLATVAVYSIALPYQIAATWRSLPAPIGAVLWFPYASSLAAAALTFTFFATFPRPMVRSRWVWAAVWLPMIVVLVPHLDFTMRAVYAPAQRGRFIDWTWPTAAATIAYGLAALAALVLGYRRSRDATERRRIRVLLFGSSVGLLSVIPVVAAYWTHPSSAAGGSVFGTPAAAIGTLFGLAFPVSFAVAIVRHRLFDAAVVIRRGLQYALARRVLVSIVPAAIALLAADLWLHREVSLAQVLRSRGWIYVAVVGLAVLARLRRDAWLDALDRRFFRERYRAAHVLRKISDELRGAEALSAAAPKVVFGIDAALHLELVALFVRDQSVFRTVATAPTAMDVEPLSVASRIAGLIDVLRRPVQIPAAARAGLLRELPPAEREWLDRSRAELLVPIQSGGGASEGLFLLGAKRSEEPYGAEDEDLLMAIAGRLAGLLARAVPAAIDAPAHFEECPSCGRCHDPGVGRCAEDAEPLVRIPLARTLGGRYRLERCIGRGGMGTVYDAVDLALDRSVAVKLLRDDLVWSAAEKERFRSEARLAASLTHAHVVTVHDFGVTDAGRAFIVMERLDGSTLREELNRAGTLPASRVVAVLGDVASAVDAAHERQMIHRDLKPENIFICGAGAGGTKVLDFGLARPLAARPGGPLTQVGLVAGTPQYMSPEHWRGAEPSPDWDLWALAVIAFEMVTGRLPFAAPPGVPPRFDTLSTMGLPAPVSAFFTRALAIDPLDRPTSARDLVDDLKRALAEGSVA